MLCKQEVSLTGRRLVYFGMIVGPVFAGKVLLAVVKILDRYINTLYRYRQRMICCN